MESGTKFVAADMPAANEMTIHVLAAVAQHDRKAISQRTKDALAVAKARGKKLGNPNGARLCAAGRSNKNAVATINANAEAHAQQVRPISAGMQAEGITCLHGLARSSMTPAS
jgi:DNA invertase Pin-like site-specific DNA recombinase